MNLKQDDLQDAIFCQHTRIPLSTLQLSCIRWLQNLRFRYQTTILDGPVSSCKFPQGSFSCRMPKGGYLLELLYIYFTMLYKVRKQEKLSELNPTRMIFGLQQLMPQPGIKLEEEKSSQQQSSTILDRLVDHFRYLPWSSFEGLYMLKETCSHSLVGDLQTAAGSVFLFRIMKGDVAP